jgi:phage shock protein E
MSHRNRSLAPLLCTIVIALTPFAARGAEAEKKKPAEPPKISLEEFEKRKAERDTVVLDVRSEEEYAKGHVAGAVNLPINAKDFDDRIKQLDKDKTYLVHCQAGVRSERACKKMDGVVPKMFNFAGGMNEWKKAGKPVEEGSGK